MDNPHCAIKKSVFGVAQPSILILSDPSVTSWMNSANLALISLSFSKNVVRYRVPRLWFYLLTSFLTHATTVVPSNFMYFCSLLSTAQAVLASLLANATITTLRCRRFIKLSSHSTGALFLFICRADSTRSASSTFLNYLFFQPELIEKAITERIYWQGCKAPGYVGCLATAPS